MALDDRIEAGLQLLREGHCKTVAEAARNTGCKRTTLGEHRRAELAGEATADMTTVTQPGELPPEWTPEKLAAYYGIGEEWIPARIRGNLWGDPEDPRNQLRIDWVAKTAMLEIPDLEGWEPPKATPRKRKTGEPKTVVVVSDHHAPFEDRELHSCFLQYLRDEQPDEGIINGDLLDFHAISRHRNRDGFAAPVNECLRSGFHILLDYLSASPATKWKLKKGNHCQRIEDVLVDNAPGLHKIVVPGDETPALSLRKLLRLDELGIEYIEADWDMAKVRVSKKLSVRHGPATGKAATHRLLDKFSMSVIQGHTHRLSLTFRTEHSDDEDVPTTTRMGAEGGCMCQIKDGLGYTDSPDWNQGFLTAKVWDDGDFHTLPAVYVPGRLFAPNGRRYTP